MPKYIRAYGYLEVNVDDSDLRAQPDAEGNTPWFGSDRPDGQGGLFDIFASRIKDDGMNMFEVETVEIEDV